MAWRPVAHSDVTDLAAAPAPLWDKEHEPFEFQLDEADEAHAAAARHHLRRHLDRLNAMPLKTQKVVDTP